FKTTVESVETNCDHDFVEYFRQEPNSGFHVFRVVKAVNSFTIGIMIRAFTSKRIMYQLNHLNGCQFLNNPFISQAMNHTYRTIIANNSVFRCPIPPKVYFLQNLRKAKVFRNFHPPGRYQLSMRVKTPTSSSPFVMEVLWKYNVI
ncbi:hypothetical protein KR044_007325, partial [Drosophila immigrans]